MNSARISPGDSASPALIAALHATVAARRSCRACAAGVAIAGERRQRLAQASLGIEARMRHRHAADEQRVSAEPLDLEAEPREHVAVRLERVALGGTEVQRQRKEQSLRRRLAALEHAHELLVQHALVRRVLVDEHDAVVVLEHHVGAPELQRAAARRRRSSRSARRGERLAAVGDASASSVARRDDERLVGERAVAASRRRSARSSSTSTSAPRRATRAPRRPASATPSAAPASNVPSARRTASSTARSTCQRSRKRTSAFAGCTLTSTLSAGNDDVEKQRRTHAGAGSSSDTPLRRRARMPASRTGAPVHREEDAAARRADVGRALDEPADCIAPRTSSTSTQPLRRTRAPQSAATRSRSDARGGQRRALACRRA